ncbi:MAG TPA: hypothetical protein IAA26_10015 [Candidatus Blautia faecipullorum]|nr:hypothetical protein [Candidatus Blautia faecipullorum]
MEKLRMLAFDMGASNGRAVYAEFDGKAFDIKEIYRFMNQPVKLHGKLYWDILRLFYEIKQSIKKCRERGLRFDCLGINSWGNTIGLLDSEGDLLVNPYHYRDDSVEETIKDFYKKHTREWLFEQTLYLPMKIQPTAFWHYLTERKKGLTELTENILMISDLFNYFLTGIKASEKTMAATSAMVDMRTGKWKENLITALGISENSLPQIVENGTVLGPLLPEITEELQLDQIPLVIAVAGHDTAAVSGCIGKSDLEESLYLSCGTWSCMGCTVKEPVEDAGLLEYGITNDMGLYNVHQLRFNHTGLWILQECKRFWEDEGEALSWQTLMEQAEEAEPFTAAIDVEAELFFKPEKMPEKIQQYCKENCMKIPETKGQICRVILESLAYRYRYSLDCLMKFSGCRYSKLTIAGGGVSNTLLCQWTANILGIPVETGIKELAVMGNLLQQAVSMKRLESFEQGLSVLKNIEEGQKYFPHQQEKWNHNYQYFTKKFGWKQV